MSDYNSVPMKPDGEMRLVKPEEYDRLQRSRDAWRRLATVAMITISRHGKLPGPHHEYWIVLGEVRAALDALGETVEG